MYIAPNTSVLLLTNCPLDSTYDHTIYFISPEVQENYFQSLVKFSLTNQSYQRVTKNKIKVQKTADELYDCNYLMFKNTAFGSKWFYAFINTVDYINNVTAEITYEIDVMQTWFFEHTPGECFVEREHSETDEIGDNTQPENVELGEYVTSDQKLSGISAGPGSGTRPGNIVVAATFDKTLSDTTLETYNGLFSGVTYNVFSGERQYIEASDFLQDVAKAGKQDGILAVFLAPYQLDGTEQMSPTTYESDITKEYDDLNGYSPKNKKLFTYPYNFLYVTNMQGAGAAYPYELFDSANCQYQLIMALSCNPSVIFVPKKYKGVPYNYDEKMTLSGWPQLAYNVDSFKAWLAQTASSLDIQAISTAGNLVTGALTGNLPAIVSGAINLGTLGANIYQHSILPNQAKGGGGSVTMASSKLLDFMLMKKSIRSEYAKTIDDYFNAYGYATNRVKTPNRRVRPYWTYCKTRNATLTGNVPADDMSKLVSIYNNGITFWANGNNVGNYSLNNSPLNTQATHESEEEENVKT